MLEKHARAYNNNKIKRYKRYIMPRVIYYEIKNPIPLIKLHHTNHDNNDTSIKLKDIYNEL